MTICRVERRPALPEHARRYPLAHRSGIQMFVLMMAADHHWRPLTARQKQALSEAYHHAFDGLTEGDELPLPPLLAGVDPRTVRALERRHLIADGALTALAVEVVGWAEPLEEQKRRTRAGEAS